MLNWAKRFSIFCLLDNQRYSVWPHRYECLLAAGTVNSLSSETAAFTDVDAFLKKRTWCFGHLSYELKNELHGFRSAKKDTIGFPLFYFFQPEVVCCVKGNRLHIEAPDPDSVYLEISRQSSLVPPHPLHLSVQQRLSKTDYVNRVTKLQRHILRGDCYEVNFCTEFFAVDVALQPVPVFDHLMRVSPHPFSALYKLEDAWLICASPERFLFKEGNNIFSQPMKGTSKRDADNAVLDAANKQALYNSAKERAENVMVVDLVRNDLSKICKEGSVEVDELFGLYSYPQVHQMVSTVKGDLKEGISFSGIIKALFPMGSMTGAPKHRVMQLIDQYEPGSRGIFSGTVGYIQPDGDFDFNVVIRSLMYSKPKKYLSYKVGSGITFYSDGEKEWEECLLKAAALKKVLTA